MKKIVIFTGGSGSLSIQEALNFQEVDVTCILNAYDNGKSTGAVRKVADGLILGPSDLRKNQIFRAKMNGTIENDLYEFLDKRVDNSNYKDFKDYIYTLLDSLYNLKSATHRILRDALDAFFSKNNAKLIDYIDFSISNVVYAGLALCNNNSLEKAGEIMGNILGIGDCVNLISDDSLYLQAITQNGDIVYDEGDIVKWKNPENPIVDIRLMDVHGVKVTPSMSEKAIQKIEEADIIIFSTGTQWSSLIPTYIHRGFYDLIAKSKADKYLFMNNTQDEDMSGKTSKDIIDNILDYYLPLKDIKIVFNSHADEEMILRSYKYDGISEKFSEFKEKKHNSKYLRQFFSKILFFKDLELFESDIYAFDLDNTLIGKGNEFYPNSLKNLTILAKMSRHYKFMIITGNSLNHLNEMLNFYQQSYFLRNIDIYVDGGNSKCRFNMEHQRWEFDKYVDDMYVMDKKQIDIITDSILKCGVGFDKIENRNSNIISIKPLSKEDREIVHATLLEMIPQTFNVFKTGRTTIDIYKKRYSKLVAIYGVDKNTKITYIGDEVIEGNDNCFAGKNDVGIYTNNVLNPIECTRFLEILETKIEK
jgi:2-phospho-L-lactate transferase/gluconeogenesis factor (CofD/UPF0052 family)